MIKDKMILLLPYVIFLRIKTNIVNFLKKKAKMFEKLSKKEKI